MNNYSSLIYFVEGATTPAEFATWLYKNPEAEALLTQEEDLPKHAQSFQNLYLYLISLDLESPASLLDAQAVIASTLNKYGLPFRRSDAPLKNFDALLKAQPKWLDLPSKYAAELMESIPPRQNSCRLHITKNLGAAKKDESGSIRTSIQGQGGSAIAAARERTTGGGRTGGGHCGRDAGALA